MVEHELSRLESVKASFDLKSKIHDSLSKGTKRNLILDGRELEGTIMKLNDGKSITVMLYILTDVILICQAEKNSSKLMKELTMIRAPFRTDKLKPIKMETPEKLALLNITEYGCPDHCILFEFPSESKKVFSLVWSSLYNIYLGFVSK